MATDPTALAVGLLPRELQDQITDDTPATQPIQSPADAGATTKAQPDQNPALRPPARCCLLRLPAEISREILITAFPLLGKKPLIQPHCCDKHGDGVCSLSSQTKRKVQPEKEEGNPVDASGKPADKPSKEKKDASATPPPLKASALDLMLMNRKLSSEISTMLYEEFPHYVHIHEGVVNGGVEFAHTGRQKLQYLDEITTDQRFGQFTYKTEFGYDRLKHVNFTIFPCHVDEPNFKHQQIGTFFMIYTLCQLLERDHEEKDRGVYGKEKTARWTNKISNLTIEFAAPPKPDPDQVVGRQAIIRRDNYLWDPLLKQPTMSSINGVTDIELILYPFSKLRSYKVDITLPTKLQNDPRTLAFRDQMVSRITGPSDGASIDDNCLLHVRAVYHDFLRGVNHMMYGTGIRREVRMLGEMDFEAEKAGVGEAKRQKTEAAFEDYAMSDGDFEYQLQCAMAASVGQAPPSPYSC